MMFDRTVRKTDDYNGRGRGLTSTAFTPALHRELL
jgi:hypothetical protein